MKEDLRRWDVAFVEVALHVREGSRKKGWKMNGRERMET